MDDVQSAIQSLGKKGDELYAKVAKVSFVDVENKCCDVQPLDGSGELFDIPWSANVEGDGEFKQPKEGSYVLVAFLDKHHAQICNVSELEKYFLKIGDVEFKIDADGFLLKKENENLKKLMSDLFKAIKKMSFTTNVGPTINLININDFEALESRFNNLLKDV